MKRFLLALLMVASLGIGLPALAGDTDPLFVNATSDNVHRARMAFSFAKNQLDRKHPVTIFLNACSTMASSRAI